MIEFTFLVVSYNQERMIVDTLESIKYQVVQYGKNRAIYLIVADDGSIDKTQSTIKKWTDENREQFAGIELVLRGENHGTSYNFADAMRRVRTQFFYSIAGDDLISDLDVISIISGHGLQKIVAAPCYFLSEGRIVTERSRYQSMAQIAFYDKAKLKKISYYKCPMLNGSFMSSDLMVEDVLKFSEQYNVLDDQARYIKLFEGADGFDYGYERNAVLIYRLSVSQITRSSGEIRKRLINAKRKLVRYSIKTHCSLANIYHNLCELCSISNPKIYKMLVRFLDVDNYLFYFQKIRKEKEINLFLDKHLSEERINSINSHVAYIERCSEDFLSRINNV